MVTVSVIVSEANAHRRILWVTEQTECRASSIRSVNGVEQQSILDRKQYRGSILWITAHFPTSCSTSIELAWKRKTAGWNDYGVPECS